MESHLMRLLFRHLMESNLEFSLTLASTSLTRDNSFADQSEIAKLRNSMSSSSSSCLVGTVDIQVSFSSLIRVRIVLQPSSQLTLRSRPTYMRLSHADVLNLFQKNRVRQHAVIQLHIRALPKNRLRLLLEDKSTYHGHMVG